MDVGVTDNAIWQCRWRRLATQPDSWYATPSGSVGCCFTAILVAEWRGVLGRSWKSERPLVFPRVILTKTLGVRRAKYIRARTTRRIELWDRGLHVGLVGDADAEGADRECRASSCGDEEDEAVAQSYHDTVLSGKLRQAFHWATDREGGGVSYWTTNAQKSGDQLQRSSGRSTHTCVSPPWKIPRVQPSRSMGRCRKW